MGEVKNFPEQPGKNESRDEDIDSGDEERPLSEIASDISRILANNPELDEAIKRHPSSQRHENDSNDPGDSLA